MAVTAHIPLIAGARSGKTTSRPCETCLAEG